MAKVELKAPIVQEIADSVKDAQAVVLGKAIELIISVFTYGSIVIGNVDQSPCSGLLAELCSCHNLLCVSAPGGKNADTVLAECLVSHSHKFCSNHGMLLNLAGRIHPVNNWKGMCIGTAAAQGQQQHNRLQGDADVQYSGDEKPDSLQQSLKQFSHNFPPQKHGFAGQQKTLSGKAYVIREIDFIPPLREKTEP